MDKRVAGSRLEVSAPRCGTEWQQSLGLAPIASTHFHLEGYGHEQRGRNALQLSRKTIRIMQFVHQAMLDIEGTLCAPHSSAVNPAASLNMHSAERLPLD